MAKGVVLPNHDSETNSAICRDGDTKIEDNLFYSAIKLMPDSFPESIKKI
jgi:hypothetical protein